MTTAALEYCPTCRFWARDGFADEPHHVGCPNHPGPFVVSNGDADWPMSYRFTTRRAAEAFVERATKFHTLNLAITENP